VGKGAIEVQAPTLSGDQVSHPAISISECEPFFQKKLKFSKGFHLFPFEMILFEFIFNLK
jgi:hypothetical protein